jgi:hypothetical protein
MCRELALGARAAAVVAHELDVGRLVQAAEGVAQAPAPRRPDRPSA